MHSSQQTLVSGTIRYYIFSSVTLPRPIGMVPIFFIRPVISEHSPRNAEEGSRTDTVSGRQKYESSAAGCVLGLEHRKAL